MTDGITIRDILGDLVEGDWTDTISLADHVGGLVYERVGETLKDHFPEYNSASCLCGESIQTYDLWIEHILKLLGKPL